MQIARVHLPVLARLALGATLLVLFVASPRTLAQAEAPISESTPLGVARQIDSRTGASTGATERHSLLDNSMVRTGGSLALVLALIFGLATLAKKLTAGKSGLASALGVGGPSPAGLLEVLGRYPLGRGHTLVLLKVDNRVLLLAQSSGGVKLRGASGTISVLSEFSAPEDVASILLKTQDAEDRSMNARFSAMLNEADARHDGVVDLTRPRKPVAAADKVAEMFELPKAERGKPRKAASSGGRA